MIFIIAGTVCVTMGVTPAEELWFSAGETGCGCLWLDCFWFGQVSSSWHAASTLQEVLLISLRSSTSFRRSTFAGGDGGGLWVDCLLVEVSYLLCCDAVTQLGRKF